MSRFENQVAVVTGGADGLGKSIAARLASEGAQVFIFDHSQDKLEACRAEFSASPLKIEYQLVDVTNETEVGTAIDKVVELAGQLDILVNSAGIVGPNGVKLADVVTSDFDQVYAVNLRGSFLVTKYALKAMTTKNYGRIMLIASIAGKEGNAGMAAYSATKAGVIGLVKAVGKEYAETGITINGLAPAVVRTGMVEAMDPNQVKYMTDKIPMKRCCSLEEVAALVSFAVSKEASFNTGFVFDLTGGRAVY